MTDKAPWTPKEREQEIVAPKNDGWIGGDNSMFGHVVEKKKWTPVKAKAASPPSSPRKSNQDWLGGPGAASHRSPMKSPKPIKIEGMSSSVKDNPFLKKDHR